MKAEKNKYNKFKNKEKTVQLNPKSITNFKKCRVEVTNKEANIHIRMRYKDGKRHTR